jgi:hypothetical protein
MRESRCSALLASSPAPKSDPRNARARAWQHLPPIALPGCFLFNISFVFVSHSATTASGRNPLARASARRGGRRCSRPHGTARLCQPGRRASSSTSSPPRSTARPWRSAHRHPITIAVPPSRPVRGLLRLLRTRRHIPYGGDRRARSSSCASLKGCCGRRALQRHEHPRGLLPFCMIAPRPPSCSSPQPRAVVAWTLVSATGHRPYVTAAATPALWPPAGSLEGGPSARPR